MLGRSPHPSGVPTPVPSTAVPSPLPSSRPSAAPSSAPSPLPTAEWPVEPFNCSLHPNPIQVLRLSGEYKVVELDIVTGTYEDIYPLDWLGSYHTNAVGLLEASDGRYFIYTAFFRQFCLFDEHHYWCFPSGSLEVSRPNAGVVIGSTYYYTKSLGELVDHVWTVYEIEGHNPVFSEETAVTFADDLWNGGLADFTYIEEDGGELVDDGDDDRTYLVGVDSGLNVAVVMRVRESDGLVDEYAVVPASVNWQDRDPETGNGMFGSAYSYPVTGGDTRVFFASNEGWGLFELTLPLTVPASCFNAGDDTSAHAVCDAATAVFVWRTESAATKDNDGFNCRVPVAIPDTFIPSFEPTTASPSLSRWPSPAPSAAPSASPSASPSAPPSPAPSSNPSPAPSPSPTAPPSPGPSSSPTTCPSSKPSSTPTATPSYAPTAQPSPEPSPAPYGFRDSPLAAAALVTTSAAAAAQLALKAYALARGGGAVAAVNACTNAAVLVAIAKAARDVAIRRANALKRRPGPATDGGMEAWTVDAPVALDATKWVDFQFGFGPDSDDEPEARGVELQFLRVDFGPDSDDEPAKDVTLEVAPCDDDGGGARDVDFDFVYDMESEVASDSDGDDDGAVHCADASDGDDDGAVHCADASDGDDDGAVHCADAGCGGALVACGDAPDDLSIVYDDDRDVGCGGGLVACGDAPEDLVCGGGGFADIACGGGGFSGILEEPPTYLDVQVARSRADRGLPRSFRETIQTRRKMHAERPQ